MLRRMDAERDGFCGTWHQRGRNEAPLVTSHLIAHRSFPTAVGPGRASRDLAAGERPERWINKNIDIKFKFC
jgi:hypothetical protein